ncbi:hypothetical protein JNL27_11655 [bacterium]|nr:hypothetical protein [bacterium]
MQHLLRCLKVGTLTLFLTVLVQNRFAAAQSAEELVKKAEGDLKKSHSLIIAGRHETAVDILKNVDGTIANAQKLDANQPRLSSVIKTFMTQKEKIEKKLGKEIAISFDAGEKSSASQTDRTMSLPAGGSKSVQLPYDARYPMQQFSSSYRSFEDYYAQFAIETAEMQAILIKRMQDHLDKMKTSLALAKVESSKKSVTAHPDFDDASQKIQVSENKYAELSKNYQQQVSKQNELNKKAATDMEAIKTLYSDLRNKIFDAAGGSVIYYNEPSELEPLLTRIEQFERSDKMNAQKLLESFAAKYGNTEEAIEKSTGDWQTANSYTKIEGGIQNVAKTREAIAKDLVQKYQNGLNEVKSKHDFYKVAYLTGLKKVLDMAVRFSPGFAEAIKAQDDHQHKTDTALKDFYAAVDKKNWPTHSADSPANAKELAKAAFTWFSNDIGWGQRDKDEKATDKEVRKPLDVSVHGPWSVQERDLFGNPIMYGLPVFVAVEVASEKSLNLVRVYDVTMRTEEKAGAKQSPPFFSITVGNSHYIRPSKLKK